MKIRIMYILPSLNIGGMEIALVKLLNGIDKSVYECCICCLESGHDVGPLKEQIKNIKIFSFQKAHGIDYSLPVKLARLLKKENIHIVHAKNFGSILYGSIAARLSGVPVVIADIRGSADLEDHLKSLKLLSFLIDKIVAVSRDIGMALTDRLRISNRKVAVIYNGVDLQKYGNFDVDKTKIKREIGLSEDNLVIGSVGRLSPVKDYGTLLRACRKIFDKIENARAVIVGDGPDREKLEMLARELEIYNKIAFLGFRIDIDKLMNIMDVFVLCSVSEGLSNVILEAMASRLPVVATAVGGNREIVINDKTGYLVPVGNPEELAQNVIQVLSDNGKAKEIGEESRRRIEKHFSLEAMIEQHHILYRELAQNKLW